MQNKWQQDQWVRPNLKRYRKLLCLVFFLGVITILCGVGLMFVAGYLISRTATHPYNILVVYVPVLLTRAFGIGRPVFKYLERINSHNWVLKITSSLRKRLYVTLESSALFLSEQFQSGKLLGFLADDIDHLENLYLRTIFPIVVAYLTGIVLLIGLGIVSWPYALVMFVLFAIILGVIPLLSQSIQGATRVRQRELVQDSYQRLTDATFGIADWMISGRETEFVQTVRKQDEPAGKLNRKANLFEWNRDFVVKLLFGLMIMVTIGWAALALTGHQESANYAAAFTLGIFPLMDSFGAVPQAAEEGPMYQESLNRLNDLSHQVKPQPVKPEHLPAPQSLQKIHFENVSFHYPKTDTDIIQQVSFTVPAGQSLAIIGPSGVGKTTLLELLTGSLVPTQGQVWFDQLPAHDLQAVADQWFSVLDQQPFLFNTTIMNNVRIGNEQATDDDVKKAIQEVGLADLVNELPDGLETDVSENGVRLSGGQRQRLALARILLQDNPVVVLDEPTVGLDPITEQQLITTINRVLAGKTMIWVTHHLQGLNHVNQIIFLENGHLKMQGTPAELYRTNERYRNLYRMDLGE
ncbi:thiol reductant ABC exporter subunit CydC [Fructilactobacillus cliffordii]|uniref:thiol reductant ABC exporter subunit CydC n=1 Tax=Fructilactobacillus cliffordii TaxID=2940299 RepID=UPI00209337B9|nr:thiol reductant ABC exporter subunit CydC [Fructilactobacillus cliffordii]USS86059.1 thiol reductant ABC exporter subunit CydC [Fructilactobacillus cliffordii]